MRHDVLICFLLFASIPIINALLIRWRLKRIDIALSHFQSGILCLILAIIAVTLGNILWMVLAIGSGIAQAVFTDVVFNQGLQLGYKRAIPLDIDHDLLPWGMLGPVCTGLILNALAHPISLRIIKRNMSA